MAWWADPAGVQEQVGAPYGGRVYGRTCTQIADVPDRDQFARGVPRGQAGRPVHSSIDCWQRPLFPRGTVMGRSFLLTCVAWLAGQAFLYGHEAPAVRRIGEAPWR